MTGTKSRWLLVAAALGVSLLTATGVSEAASARSAAALPSTCAKPIAFSIERAPARDGPSVMEAEWRFRGSLGRSYGVSAIGAVYAPRGRPLAGSV